MRFCLTFNRSAEPEQVSYSGEVVGESAIKVLDEIGTKVVHKYLIDNRGPWRVDEFKVQIHWPYQTENNKKEGKWLLYMTDIPVVDGRYSKICLAIFLKNKIGF